MAKTQDIYKMNAKNMQLCYKKFLNLCQTSKKREYVMLKTISGKFNAILRVTYVTWCYTLRLPLSEG